MGVESDCAVKVAVRERPVRKNLNGENETSVINYHPNSNILVVDERPFSFDYILGPDVSQSQLYEKLIKPLVALFKQGYNCTALAYGQTGTGKSYTMGLDSINFEGDNIGVIPRCLRELFEKETICDSENTDMFSKKVELYASFIEIYNEKVYDLLAENSTEPFATKGKRYAGASQKLLSSLSECYEILKQGNKNRHVRPTEMNSQSSRSHAIFTIHQEATSLGLSGQKTIIRSCMNIVDLAGSEGVRRTGHQGVAMSEGVNINQGLLSIGKVLMAITDGSKVIPYRDSVLSMVLQDSLNANSYLTLLVCLSPHRQDLSETLSTLRFAQKAKQLKNTPQINSIIADIKKNAKLKQTPHKANPLTVSNFNKVTPFKRPVGAFTTSVPAKTVVKGNTFCTPKRMHIKVNKCNQTDIITKRKSPKLSNIAINLPKMDQLESTHNNGSPLNSSLVGSLLSLNISSSTAVEGVTVKTTNSNNISPVIRKCLDEFKIGMENRIMEMFQMNMQTFIAAQTPAAIQQMKHNTEDTTRKQGAKCQLFNSSSDLFKVPELPSSRIAPHTSSPNSENVGLTSFTDTFFAGLTRNDRNDLNKSIRRSVRLSQRFSEKTCPTKENQVDQEEMISINHTNRLRRSMRKSVVGRQEPVNDCHNCQQNAETKAGSEVKRKKNSSGQNIKGKFEYRRNQRQYQFENP